jgi:hypothetical protein
MALMVTDSYTAENQEIFRQGMISMNDRCRELYREPFLSVTAGQRLEVLEILDLEQMEFMKEKEEKDPAHYFRMMKELALLGYFTSEIGCTQAMRYRESPGRFDPCTPYRVGDKAWAAHA